jgi:ureidoglycolate hydrolase
LAWQITGGFLDTDLIEVKNYEGEGYKPLVSFESWRVAVLRYLDELNPSNINSMERHTATDEVFVLTKGKAMLVLGGNRSEVAELSTFKMNIGEINNVKKNAWHTIIVSRDAHLVIIENDDTCKENSEYCSLSNDLQTTTQKIARDFLTL